MDENWKENLKEFVSLYKIPLILATVGVLFFIIAISFFIKTQNTSQDVVFSSSESSPSGKIVKSKIQVDIEGAVMAPGVYQIEEGSRITSVLAKAGGLSAEADRQWAAKNLNLAAKLVDGGKIYIPSLVETSEGKIQSSNIKIQNSSDLNNSSNLLGVTTGQVNINSASQSELEALPGIGSVTATKIINGRPYQTIEELKLKKIVGNSVYNKIKDLITIY